MVDVKAGASVGVAPLFPPLQACPLSGAQQGCRWSSGAFKDCKVHTASNVLLHLWQNERLLCGTAAEFGFVLQAWLLCCAVAILHNNVQLPTLLHECLQIIWVQITSVAVSRHWTMARVVPPLYLPAPCEPRLTWTATK